MATLCLSGSAIIKAGTNVGSVPVTAWDDFIEEAEGYLSALTKFDLVGNWGTLSGSSAGPMLTEYCARSAAIQAIAYDMATVGITFSSLIEPEDMIQLHVYRIEQIEKLLENSDIQDFMTV